MKIKQGTFVMAVALLLLAGCAEQDAKGDPMSSTASVSSAGSNDPAGSAAVLGEESADAQQKNKFLDPERLAGGGQFGFADKAGKRLITVEGERPAEHPESYALALGDAGTVLQITFRHKQDADAEDDGRASTPNFDHMAGYVYDVTQGTAKPNESYFLTAADNWAAEAALAIDASGNGSPADDAFVKAVETQKERKVDHAALIATVGEDAKLYLVQFEKRKEDMLASLVLQRQEVLLFHDFPAKYNSNSTWRVDDQGEIQADQFAVMFAGACEDGVLLAVTWMGAEGENSFILVQKDDTLEETGAKVGRYMAA